MLPNQEKYLHNVFRIIKAPVFHFFSPVKIYQFKAKYSEIQPYRLQLGNISKNVLIDSMKKTVFVNYNATDT